MTENLVKVKCYTHPDATSLPVVRNGEADSLVGVLSPTSRVVGGSAADVQVSELKYRQYRCHCSRQNESHTMAGQMVKGQLL